MKGEADLNPDPSVVRDNLGLFVSCAGSCKDH